MCWVEIHHTRDIAYKLRLLAGSSLPGSYYIFPPIPPFPETTVRAAASEAAVASRDAALDASA